MRSVWCALVAICLVVGGARASRATGGPPGASELHAAKVAVAAHALRRAPSSQRRVGAFVAPAAVRVAPPQRVVAIATGDTSRGVAQSRSLFVKSSRGPPRV